MGGKKKSKVDEDGDAAETSTSIKEDTTVSETSASWKRKNFDQEKKTNLGDTATIKRLLDDAVIEVLDGTAATRTRRGEAARGTLHSKRAWPAVPARR